MANSPSSTHACSEQSNLSDCNLPVREIVEINLTKAQIEVIAEVLKTKILGGTSEVAGDKLCLSKDTVEDHLYNSYKKAGVTNFMSLLRVLENASLTGKLTESSQAHLSYIRETVARISPQIVDSPGGSEIPVLRVTICRAEVLKSLYEGLTTKEIADQLGISLRTAHSRIAETYKIVREDTPNHRGKDNSIQVLAALNDFVVVRKDI